MSDETAMQDAEHPTQIEQASSESPTGVDGGIPPSNMLATVLMLGGLSLAIFILLRRLYKRPNAQRGHNAVSAREKLDTVHQQASARRKAIDHYMSDAEELTRRLAATLDNKAARLEILIEDADSRLRQLESLGSIPGGESGTNEALPGESPRPSNRARLDPTVLDRARLDQLTRERGGPGSERQSSDTPTDSSADFLLRVYELADTGISALEISRKLDHPVGQIELMLNLRRQTG